NALGRDARQDEQLDAGVAGEGEGEIVALLGSRGVGWEQQKASPGVEPERLARLCAWSRVEALERDPAGEHLCPGAGTGTGAGEGRCERLRDGRDQVDERQRCG